MSISIPQLAANQRNAQKSTGPVTVKGKQVVARNAMKHGIFSKHLLLNDEKADDYQQLLQGLQAELNPMGMLENTLVERISVSIWRQQRLVRAETASIEQRQKPAIILNAVNDELNLTHSNKALQETDLAAFDPAYLNWCQTVLQEFNAIAEFQLPKLGTLAKTAPAIYEQLVEDAKSDGQPISAFLTNWEEPLGYFYELAQYCQEEIQKAQQRPLVLAIAQQVKDRRAIPQVQLGESLAKYQVMLDNELYKAIKALRETQEWRQKSLPAANGFVLEN